jgi:hypothetical protein
MLGYLKKGNRWSSMINSLERLRGMTTASSDPQSVGSTSTDPGGTSSASSNPRGTGPAPSDPRGAGPDSSDLGAQAPTRPTLGARASTHPSPRRGLRLARLGECGLGLGWGHRPPQGAIPPPITTDVGCGPETMPLMLGRGRTHLDMAGGYGRPCLGTHISDSAAQDHAPNVTDRMDTPRHNQWLRQAIPGDSRLQQCRTNLHCAAWIPMRL